MMGRIRAMSILHLVIALAYVVAFSSLHVQWDGLYGPNGLQPAQQYVRRLSQHFGKDGVQLLLQSGSLATSGDLIGVSTEGLCQALLVFGLTLSILQVVLLLTPLNKGSVFVSLNFGLIWLMYHSLVVIGQTFLSFQWDLLLGEIGFLAISSSLLPEFLPNKLTHRFLGMKLMIMSGLTKIQAQCPSWKDLTALEYHFATQPLPTPLAWYAHQLPPTLLRLSVLMTLVIEIPLAILLVLPWRHARRIGAGLQLVLQVVIAATGNYTFFNGLTAALMLAAWADDNEEESTLKEKEKKGGLWRRVEGPVTIAFIVLSAAWLMDTNQLSAFFLAVDPSMSTSREWWDGSMLRFDLPYADLQKLVSPTLAAVLIAFTWQICYCALQGGIGRPQAVFCSLFTLLIVPLSLVTFQSVADVRKELLLPQSLFDLYHQVSPGRPVSAYGLFRRMTGMAAESPLSLPGLSFKPQLVARPELVFEGYDDKTNVWREIDFKYKPGDPSRPPPWVAPHQPRLDWQMWFAALGSYQSNPWLVHLVWQLLHKDSKAWSLLDKKSENNRKVWRQGSSPPKQIRVVRYDLDFTRYAQPWTPSALERATDRVRVLKDSNQDSNLWWHRLPKGVYLDAVDLDNPSVPDFLRGNGIDPHPSVSSPAQLHSECLGKGDANLLARAVCGCILVRQGCAGGVPTCPADSSPEKE